MITLDALTQTAKGQAAKAPASGGCASSSCGSSERPDDLSPEVWEKVKDHPCYSEEAHHYFARMHVAVAPACNIQCNYCNRKYDCANESRPGVVSERLTPEQGARKTIAVAQERAATLGARHRRSGRRALRLAQDQGDFRHRRRE